MGKENKVYLLLIVSFVLFISVFIITFILKYSSIKGNINIKRKYYEIVYKSDNQNISVDKETIKVKYKNNEDLFFDIYNVGNLNATVNKVSIDNINTNLDKEKLNIKLNFNEKDFIKGGEVKRINILIEYEEEISENDYLTFNIIYSFNE